MNKFDDLFELNEKLDAVLSDMKKANKYLENELKEKRDAAQKQMFDDMDILRGYMKKVGMSAITLTTGINPIGRPDIVMEFYFYASNSELGLKTRSVKHSSDYTFHRWFKRDIPIEKADVGCYGEYKKEYMYTIMKNWDVAYTNMQNDLFDKIKEFMAEKAAKVTQKKSELVTLLDDFCRKE